MELVENIVDQAMEQRPDLMARLAEVKKARAKLWPTFSQGSSLGNRYWRNVRTNPPGNGSYSGSIVVGEAMLTMEWTLFDGFERSNAVHEAKARKEPSKAQLETLRLEIMRDIWEAYATTQGSHTQGFSAVIELLSAQKDLAHPSNRNRQPRQLTTIRGKPGLCFRCSEPGRFECG